MKRDDDFLNVIELKTDELIAYENNPRNNDGAVDAVANSIAEFGFKVPIIIDKDNVIVCGHTRLKAAEKLGLETVPCIRADDLNEEQIKAFRLSDNKVSELSGWDYSKLDIELAELEGFDMSSFGFELNVDNIDVEQFFEQSEPKEKEPKRIQCPHCGEWFEQ